jgi:hypothetical protein
VAAVEPTARLPIGRIALYCAIGSIIGSIVLVALYRVLPPLGTPHAVALRQQLFAKNLVAIPAADRPLPR